MKKQNGITIISLIVTIIILIILAGVSINLILGKNGILTIAKQAKENTELAKIEEETALNELYHQISETGDSSISYDDVEALVEFKREIASAISDMGVTTLEDADVSTMASNIRSISGASSADKVSYNNTNSGLESTNVQGAIDEVNNILTWKEVSSIDDIPETASEVKIIIKSIMINNSFVHFENIIGYSEIKNARASDTLTTFTIGASINTVSDFASGWINISNASIAHYIAVSGRNYDHTINFFYR